MKYKVPIQLSNYSEYFMKKSPNNSTTRGRVKRTNNSHQKSIGILSKDKIKPNISLNTSTLLQKRTKGEKKGEKWFQTPSLKAISISLNKKAIINPPTNNKPSKLSKYMLSTQKYKQQLLKKMKNSKVKSNRILPKYEKPRIKEKNSVKSLSKMDKYDVSSYNGEFSLLKSHPMTGKSVKKTKRTSKK